MEVSDHQTAIPERLLGKPCGERGLTLVRAELEGGAGLCRAELARRVCVRRHWRSAGGADQLLSARVGLLRLRRAGGITLPAPRNGNGNGQPLARAHPVGLTPRPVSLRADLVPELFLQRVNQPDLSAIYNGLIDQWHDRGYTPMAGAQVRYWVGWPEGWLGAIGFGAGAGSVAARYPYIGWRPVQRQRRLHLILNHSRFLLAPWVRRPNLASRVLGQGNQSPRRTRSDRWADPHEPAGPSLCGRSRHSRPLPGPLGDRGVSSDPQKRLYHRETPTQGAGTAQTRLGAVYDCGLAFSQGPG